MNKKKGHTLHKAVILLFLLVQFAYVFLIGLPQPVLAVSNFSQANLTLSNSRLSLRAAITSTVSNTSFITSSVPAAPASDVDTVNLFPQDIVCFDNPGTAASNCMNQTTYTVTNIPTTTTFGTSAAVTPGFVTPGMNVVATQSARMTFTFTPTTYVPSGQYIQIHIPDTGTYIADGMPDAVGFDSNSLTTGNIDTNITPTGFTKSTSTLNTSASTATDVAMTLSSALAAGTSYSFVVGHTSDSTLRFINPAPASGHTRGFADTYAIYIQTCSAVSSSVCTGGTIYDKTILQVAPVDGVLVSANVEETITYDINSIAGSTSACTSVTTSAASTATSFPFGSVTSFNSSIDLAQGHTVITNSANGYTLTSQSSGLLSLNGLGATKIPNSPGTTGASGNACTTAAWVTPTTNGFGYTLTNGTGGHIPSGFTAGQFCPFATVPNLIATLNGVSSAGGDAIMVCPRLNVGATQATGTYFTNLTFIATPKF